ncbi:hypothetical protein EHS25_003511 [Saitozyma podzolica]|uniref:Nuclear protein DGCR14 n=1 Tax=Saitozyma podzolica TaxID=1890683 RepID=A0A427Y7F1_9TREE|nr:hypothetical protein EHS25_003511 [Saitozyma podzolica]
MQGDASSNALIPRTGPAPKVIAGPRPGQQSLYQQHVLDEDTYTDALSHIITRDFFPNLPHIHATNAYLSALTNNDPELLSASIRRLAALAAEKEEASGKNKGKGRSKEADDALDARRRELENMGTPYIAMPGGRRPMRTPVGARGWDTPTGSTSRRPDEDDEDDFDELEGATPGPSRPKKRRKPVAPPRVRDDLSLDAFQRNYTSEDNASFVQIVDEENRQRREERWGWAWEAQKRAEERRIEGEERRKMILDAATSGNWRVDGEGRRLIGGLAEGGTDRAEGEAWKEQRKLIAAVPGDTDEVSENVDGADGAVGSALVPHASSSALIKATDAVRAEPNLREEPLPPEHPLGRALSQAGLPATALVSAEDGALVPLREATSGSGQGRGRGDEEKHRREETERAVMGEEREEHLGLAESGADHWGFKTRNNFYFSADANTNPYPTRNTTLPSVSRQAPPAISHANTRLPEEEEPAPSSRSSRRGSSPSRSLVDAAVKGTPYHRSEPSLPSINNYPLLPNDPSPSPQDLPSLLTWGTLLATPKALDGSDDPLDTSRPTFKMPESKRRDEIGRKLADKASRAMNERAKAGKDEFGWARGGYSKQRYAPAERGDTEKAGWSDSSGSEVVGEESGEESDVFGEAWD